MALLRWRPEVARASSRSLSLAHIAAGAIALAGFVIGISKLGALVNVHVLATQLRGAVGGSSLMRACIAFCCGLVLSCTLFPMSIFAVVCGLLMGATEAVVIVVLAASVSAGIEREIGAFVMYRWRWGRLLEASRRLRPAYQGHALSSVLAIRLSPFLPFALTNYAMGALDVRFRDVFLGTFIAVLPRTLLLVGVIGTAQSGHIVLLSGSGIVFAIIPSVVGLGLLARMVKRFGSRAAGEQEIAPSLSSGTEERRDSIGLWMGK